MIVLAGSANCRITRISTATQMALAILVVHVLVIGWSIYYHSMR
jgi:hypothetical protein